MSAQCSPALGCKAWGLRALRFGHGLALAALLGACSSTSPTAPLPPALQAAQRLEQRAAQAFMQRDWASAQSDYQQAAALYASLALSDAQLRALLSLARVQADGGAAEQARATVASVLNRMDAARELPATAAGAIQTSTRLLAHGRAAALFLASDTKAARSNWKAAQDLCAKTCPEAASLQVLEARIALQQGQNTAALAAATAALASKPTPAEQANALRVRAYAALALQQAPSAVTDAQAALAIDQSAGLADKVLEDLRCLLLAHRQTGNLAQVAHVQRLLDEAMAASGQPKPAAGPLSPAPG